VKEEPRVDQGSPENDKSGGCMPLAAKSECVPSQSLLPVPRDGITGRRAARRLFGEVPAATFHEKRNGSHEV
jgi:hypothetical protein